MTGCPCPNYDCPSLKKSILVLNDPGYKKPKALLLHVDGGADFDIKFDSNGISVFAACSIVWDNEMYIYKKTDISKVASCKLEKVGTLPFRFSYGGCTVTNNQVFLCFLDNNEEYDLCRKSNSPLGEFVEVDRSHFVHGLTQIASSDSKSGTFHTVSTKNIIHTEVFFYFDVISI